METIQNILENSDLIRYLPTVIGPAVIATLEMVVLSAVLYHPSSCRKQYGNGALPQPTKSGSENIGQCR